MSSTPVKKLSGKSDPDTPESHVQAAKKKRSVTGNNEKRKDKEPHSVEPDGSHFFSFPLYELSAFKDLILVGGGGGSVASGVPNMWGLFRWNKDKQELTRVFLEQNGTNVVTNGAIAPNGKVVAIGRGRECLLVEIKGDSVGETRKFESEEESDKPKSEDDDDSEQKTCVFSRSGKHILCAGTSGRVTMFSVDSLERVFRSEPVGNGPVTKLAASAISDHVAAVSPSKLFTWICSGKSLEGSSQVSVGTLCSAKGAQFRGAAFSKDLLAVGVVSRVEKRSEIVLLGGSKFADVIRVIQTAKGDPQTCISSSIDGKLLGSGTADGGVSVYSTSGSRVMTTRPHSFFVSAVTFAADGRHIMSGSGDCSLKTQAIVQEKSNWKIILAILILIIALLIGYFK